jgi:small subunit ribosomal protein S5
MNNQSRVPYQREPSEFEEQVVQINRVSKKTKGGNKIGFSALAVVGDKKGKVGVGLGKAPDVSSAIRKGIAYAKKHLIEVPLTHGTIPFRIDIKVGAAKIMLKPAPPGSGIIAGGAVRSVVQACGIQNISSKVLGTGNKANNVHATLEALKRVSELAKKRDERMGK